MPDPDLTERQREALEALPQPTYEAWGDALGVDWSTAEWHRHSLDDEPGIEIEKADGQWRNVGPFTIGDKAPAESDSPTLPDLSDVDPEGEPDPDALTDREDYIVGELQTGATVDELAADLDERETVVTQHLRDLRREGWDVYIDESADLVAIEGDHNLRSSEHTGTRTRKANRWWELRHNDLVRRFKGLATPTADLEATDGHEDWVLHLTDLHAGDRVRRDDGTVIYSTDEVPAIIDYATEQALALAEKHASAYDAAHLLWGGDFLTNEGIYEGQFEDLDAWLDEQHDALVAPLIRQLKAFAERFPTVQVVGMVGNHGTHRASGTSRQANADLILYKHVRNTVAELQQHAGLLDNVRFRIGQAKAYRNFPLRGGELRGHLRHGQHRRPQAETSARKKEWLSTLREHEFDVAAMGHHHIAGRIPWDGPPIICSPSPKPSGEFVERLGEGVPGGQQDVATVFGVSDDGLTAVFPVDTRRYSDPEVTV
jgi:DNA-binding transcriptional ArsR family regulator